MSSSSPIPPNTSSLPLRAFKDCNKQTRKDGFIFGGCALFLSGFFSHRVLRLSRNNTILATLSATVISSYMFAQQSTRQCLQAKMEAMERARKLGTYSEEGGDEALLSDEDVMEKNHA
ncbi:hypothetical protein BJ684DRAFT_19041 [Piptocephalis cylindrospora]|uniref:Uncharacterized protein n=1 Tax=Piptocephalis cylindrospora TaxID=1907219 RepID=A0A4P9Y663_9FUNG|nr:hypothetical protein BJ684DRAFT_19041 [Piptocephalis cylindrospora]|eukprot:RKP14566.1 hypothetical protein BJ684DRAFT_19041 [Piptocephalis cylindrospora]